MGKGEIARYEQFLLFLQCFQKTCTAHIKNQGLFGKGLTCRTEILDNGVNVFNKRIPTFNDPEKEAF